MSDKFTATVTTIVYCNNVLELQDRITFANVDQAFVDFLDGSCKATLRELMRWEANPDDVAWMLHYQTTVSDDQGNLVVNRPLISFPAMRKDQIYQFLTLALAELARANAMRYGDAPVG